MLKSKSLSNLICETNIKPVCYNIKLQNSKSNIMNLSDNLCLDKEKYIDNYSFSVSYRLFSEVNTKENTNNKPLSYSNFLSNNINSTKSQRREAIRLFYENLLK